MKLAGYNSPYQIASVQRSCRNGFVNERFNYSVERVQTGHTDSDVKWSLCLPRSIRKKSSYKQEETKEKALNLRANEKIFFPMPPFSGLISYDFCTFV